MITDSINNDLMSIGETAKSEWLEYLPNTYKSSSSSVFSDSQWQLTRLKTSSVKIEDYSSVQDFLSKHSGLIPYFDEIPGVVISRFGNVPMSLSIFSDPDSNGEQELFLEIETKESPLEANKKLNELNRSWLLNIDDSDSYLFNTSLIFKR